MLTGKSYLPYHFIPGQQKYKKQLSLRAESIRKNAGPCLLILEATLSGFGLMAFLALR
jgi:uncharacterized membrane-anchored protein